MPTPPPVDSQPHATAPPTTGAAAADPPFDATKLPPVADIRGTIDAILALKARGQTLDQVRQAHLEFARRYPKLVETAMQPDLDRGQLEYLLTMFERVQTQRVSFDAASHQVGRTMFDTYLAPNLTPEQLAAVNAKVGNLERTHAQGGAGAADIARMAAQMAGGGGGRTDERTRHGTATSTNRAARRAKVRGRGVPKV